MRPFESFGIHFFGGSLSMEPVYSEGDAVVVVSGPWKPGARGVVCRWPDSKGRDLSVYRQRNCRNGSARALWVLFEDQQYDAEGDGPYIGGEVFESDVKLILT